MMMFEPILINLNIQRNLFLNIVSVILLFPKDVIFNKVKFTYRSVGNSLRMREAILILTKFGLFSFMFKVISVFFNIDFISCFI